MEEGGGFARFAGFSTLYSPLSSFSRNYKTVRSMPSTPFHRRPRQSILDLLRAQNKARKSTVPRLTSAPSRETLQLAPSFGVKRPAFVLKYERKLTRARFQVGGLGK